MTIVLDVVPSTSTAQGKRLNRSTGHFFKGKKEKPWVEVLTALLAPHRPTTPMEEPLAATIVFVWPLTKGDQKTKAQRAALEHWPFKWHDQKPDTHNACKSVWDVMEQLGFFKDDKQIVHERIVKLRGKRPLVAIELVGFGGQFFGRDDLGDDLYMEVLRNA